tara:strand:+ start:50416 stop:51138 length:723 start_codon:yes stop_codon:yes gene_type:complete
MLARTEGRGAVALAIFDLDNTLIGGDSDNLWGQYLCERGLVDSVGFGARNEQFYQDYKAGTLDIDAYLRFALAPLAGRAPEELAAWHRDFMQRMIEPIMLPKAAALIAKHRDQGHDLLIITATNRFITGPIAHALGIDELLACEGEIIDGRYTGEPEGIPAFHAGKVIRLQHWLQERGSSPGQSFDMALDTPLENAWFYSDSHNDLPLLELVDHPVAVDPDDRLRGIAQQNNWPIISLRD